MSDKLEKNLFVGEEHTISRRYVKEIKQYLEKYSLDKALQRKADTLFGICQQYDWYYTVYKKSEQAIRVLQNYIDEDNQLNKRKRKENQKRKTKQDIEKKLYVEFFTEIYCEHYKNKYSWNEVIDKSLATEILTDYFDGTQGNYIKSIATSVEVAYESSYKKIDLTNLHKAIRIFEEALETPLPSVESSVEKIITSEWLEMLLAYLEAGNTIGFRFMATSMIYAISDGSYAKASGQKKNPFFNLKCEHGLNKLKSYIDGSIDKTGVELLGLRDVYESYTTTQKDLLELKQLP